MDMIVLVIFLATGGYEMSEQRFSDMDQCWEYAEKRANSYMCIDTTHIGVPEEWTNVTPE